MSFDEIYRRRWHHWRNGQEWSRAMAVPRYRNRDVGCDMILRRRCSNRACKICGFIGVYGYFGDDSQYTGAPIVGGWRSAMAGKSTRVISTYQDVVNGGK